MNHNDLSWESIQNIFPVNQEMIWLNNCGTTPASLKSADSVRRFLEGYARKGIYTETEGYLSVKKYIHESISELIHCNQDELAIIHNTSEGINFISHGLKLQPGDEILLLENEYPSNVYPWEHWQEQGVALRFVPVGKSEEEFWSHLTDVLSPKTKVISLSAVHWCTGMVLPLKKVGEYCQKNEIYFVVDGAQGVGNTPINVKEFHIDFMAFSGWKWLLGPLGIGMLFVNRDKLDKIKPIFKGTDSVTNAEEYLPYKSEFKKSVDRFEFSTGSFIDWVYFKASLSILREVGWGRVLERIHSLASVLKTHLFELGFGLESENFSSPTGIVTALHKDRPTATLVSHLRANHILVAERLGKIRFSPHIYLSEQQLGSVREVLRKIL
jgi:cysteine desulfurase / selenocysteine lyase